LGRDQPLSQVNTVNNTSSAAKKSRLLLNQHPLLVFPDLAVVIGLNESLILQQIHYWHQMESVGVRHGEHKWVYNTYTQWQKQFPFWSIDTIKRTIRSLEKLNLLISISNPRVKIDRTKWYRIDYEVLHDLEESTSNPCNETIVQSPLMDSAIAPDVNASCPNIHTENTFRDYSSETTQAKGTEPLSSKEGFQEKDTEPHLSDSGHGSKMLRFRTRKIESLYQRRLAVFRRKVADAQREGAIPQPIFLEGLWQPISIEQLCDEEFCDVWGNYLIYLAAINPATMHQSVRTLATLQECGNSRAIELMEMAESYGNVPAAICRENM
jgi:hypothetical protein